MTAVEYLVRELPTIHWEDAYYSDLFERAKEMESGHAQLYAIYCLTSIKENLPVIRFEDFIKLEGGDK